MWGALTINFYKMSQINVLIAKEKYYLLLNVTLSLLCVCVKFQLPSVGIACELIKGPYPCISTHFSFRFFSTDVFVPYK